MDFYFQYFALLALLASVAMLLMSISRLATAIRRPRRNPPPGPKPWPIIGNLNLITSMPHRSIHTLAQKYGELMLLKFGNFPVVVASSPEMAKQLLRIHDATFACRPPLAAGKYTAYNYSDMTWAPCGLHWQQARRIFRSELFNPKNLESFEPIRVDERRKMFGRLRCLSGEAVVVREHLMECTLRTISRIVIGDKYFGGDGNEGGAVVELEEFKGMLEEWFFLNSVLNIGDWIPWLSFLDLQGYVKRMKALAGKLHGFLDYVVDDHCGRRGTAGDEGLRRRDVADALLDMAEHSKLEVELTMDCIKAFLQDLLAGGADTSAITVEWAILELLKHPHVIEKAKEELSRVIGKHRWVEESDWSQLPYIEAIIMESMRLHPLSPLLAPHYAVEDCNIAGYDISKGTTIMVSTWTIGRDPKLWDAPEEFLPERFMGKEFDIRGSNFTLLPFGSGRRRCPGYTLGLRLVRTLLANLLHGFELKLVEGMSPRDISVEEVYGLTTHPKHPLPIVMEPSLPPHLY